MCSRQSKKEPKTKQQKVSEVRGLGAMRKGWFSEESPMWAGLSQSLQVEKVLHQEHSKYQDIAVLQTRIAGRMLVLDGVIQATELDEFSYQEMLTHLSLYSHPNPENVLIVGGGDGGIVREVVKHSCVKHIDLCDIDERVTAVAKEFMPSMACSFNDPRLSVHFEDGAAFVKNKTKEYDVIITDSSDPVGPAEVLYRAEYYSALKNALKPGGIVCSQGESNMWLHSKVIKSLFDACKSAGFGSTEYAIVMIPTYPGGSIGALIASDAGSCKVPKRKMTPEEAATMKYYNQEIHSAAFVLPEFIRKVIQQ